MKTARKILRATLAVLLLALLGALIALQVPRVQTAIGGKVAERLGDYIDGELSIGEIRLKPFNALILKDVVILDDHPYDGRPELAVVDTLADAGYIAATFSLKGLLRKEGLHLRRATVRDLHFNLAIEDGEGSKKTRTNLERIFRIPPPNGTPQDKGNLFDIEKAAVENLTFRMVSFPTDRKMREQGRVCPPDAIDWNDLEVKGDIHVRHLRYSHLIMSGIADEVAIREKSGFAATLSGDVRVGGGMTRIRSLRIDDGLSSLSLPEFKMTYADSKAFGDFFHAVRFGGEIDRSVLDMKTLSYFVPALKGNTFRAELTGSVEGPVEDLSIRDLAFHDLGSDASGRISGRLTGLPDVNAMRTDFRVKDLRFTFDGLGRLIGEWAPGTSVDLRRFARGETLRFTGSGKGPLNSLTFQGTAGSERLGELTADLNVHNLIDPKHPLRLSGQVRTKDLAAGKILGSDALGALTLRSGLTAELGAAGPKVQIDSLRIDRLGALGYDYSGIRAAGTYSNEAFDGRIVCNDPNLNFLFQGLFNLSPRTDNAAYQFYANLGYADLNALQIDKRGKSKVSLRTNANFMYVNREDVIGNIDVADIVLENDEGRHRIGNASIQAHSNDNLNRIRFSSDFAEGTFLSSRSLLAMVRDLQELTVRKELPALGTAAAAQREPVASRLEFRFHDTRDLFSFIAPGTYIADSTRVILDIREDGRLEGEVRSGRIAFKDKYFKDLKLDLDNRGDGLEGMFSASELRLGSFSMESGSGTLYAHDNRIGLSYTYRNDADNNGELFVDGDLSRDKHGDLALRARALPSALRFNGQTWNISSDDITLLGKDIGINQFRVYSDDQALLVDGGYSPERTDTLRVKLEKLDLSMFNFFLGDKLDLRGKATGKAYVLSTGTKEPGILANLACDSVSVANHPVGLLQVGSSWNEARQGFELVLRNQLEDRRNLDARGLFTPRTGGIDLDVNLNGLNLAYAAPLVESIFSEMGGTAEGKLHLGGTLKKPALRSEGLRIRDGLLRIAYTNAAYHVDGPVDITPQGVFFRDISVTDGQVGKGTLSGGIRYDHFKDMELDIRADISNLLAVDLTAEQNDVFYGTLYGTGRLLIKGPLNDILIDADARTARTGSIHVPLRSGGGNKSTDLLTFKEPEPDHVDPYEAMMQHRAVKNASGSDLDVRIRVNATPGTTAYIEIDRESGHMLSAQGSGNIDIETRTSTGLFTINGDYALTSGDYRLSVMNLVSRDFTIQDGSSIHFNGDIMDAVLDINALYSTKASMSNLVSGMDVRRTVDCGIRISDKLSNPQISVSIDIPNLEPTTRGYVDTALNTQDKIQKQFLYLLITGSFLPAEQSGIANNSNLLYSNVASIMSGQLNSILDRLNIPLDLGLNYQTTEQQQDVFDVALSTQLFNNRVVVNGTIGNRQYAGGAATREVVGDLDVDIKLNQPGTIRLNLFSHSADQFTSFLDNSQRHGAGISWQREFNSFRDFLQDPFNRRRTPDPETDKCTLQIDSTGKATPLPANEQQPR